MGDARWRAEPMAERGEEVMGGKEELGEESWSWLVARRALICCPTYTAVPLLETVINTERKIMESLL